MVIETDVRLATPTDAKFLVPLNAPLSDAVIQRKIANEEFFVATRRSRPVAFMRIGFLWSQYPLIELILVPDEAMRGQGIGAALLRGLEDQYEATEYVYSSCVSHEERPQQWHRGKGFEDYGYLYQVNWGTEGEIFFRKRIGSTG